MEEKDQLILTEGELDRIFERLDHKDIEESFEPEANWSRPKVDRGALIDRKAVELATAEFLKRGGKICRM